MSWFLIFLIHTSGAWTIDDLLKKDIVEYKKNPFDGGNIFEKGIQDIQLVVERDDGKQGQEYFVRVNPRGIGEMRAQSKIADLSKTLIQSENIINKEKMHKELIQLAIEVTFAKKMDELIKKSTHLLNIQKSAQEKALFNSASGNLKEFLKSTIAIKSFSLKILEFHQKKSIIEAQLKLIDSQWNLENFELNSDWLDRKYVTQHLQDVKATDTSYYAQINQLKLEQLSAFHDLAVSRNNKLLDSMSVGFDDTRKEPTFSFRMSFNLPYVSSNPIQNWETQNRVVDMKLDNHKMEKYNSTQAESLKAHLLQASKDLDLDMTVKFDKQIEKAINKLQSSDPLSNISLFVDYISTRIARTDAEKSFYLSYLDWAEVTHSLAGSVFSGRMEKKL